MNKLIYNQFCFVQDQTRYVFKNNDWLSAPITTNEIEPVFKPLSIGTDPINEFVFDTERKAMLLKNLEEFNHFQRKWLP